MGKAEYAKALAIVRDDFDRHDFYDAFAAKHQTPHKKQFFRIALGSVVVGILGQAWGDLTFAADDAVNEWILHGAICLYLLGCIVAFCYGRKIARENHYAQYIDPRVIAELLRLKIFWKLAGIEESFTDHLLEEDASRFMVPICNWEIAEAPLSPADRQWLAEGKGIPAVQAGWLEDQKGYYETYLLPVDPKNFFRPQAGEKCKKERFLSAAWIRQYFKIYERMEGYASFFKTFFTWSGFVIAFILILFFILAQLSPAFDLTGVLALSWYREFIVGICPFAVATLGWLLEKNNWDVLGRQYRDTLALFRKTIAFVDSSEHSLADKKQMIKELMQYAHRENADWNDIKKNAKPEPMI